MVFGGAIWIARNQLNNRIVGQILDRQAEVLQAIALVHQVGMIESSAGLSMENPADQLLVMEELSELSGALGFRLYSPESDYLYSFPETITEGTLAAVQNVKANALDSNAVSYTHLTLPTSDLV